jgi:GntR family transcriptional regulator, transcriptional repressor for pyruvate dehydrogenase complex
MERVGLVSQVTEQLERMMALGQLPEDGTLPSEHRLARRYGVSRTTVREALRGLAARGLVVQHPGRKSRALVVDEAVTLENLGVALQPQGPLPLERRRLLEGYLSLKRDVTVELLTACCEHASDRELDLLQEACFALREAARWEQQPGRWAQREFELLQLAARVAQRPGPLLLLQSLERSFWGMAQRVLPHLDNEALQQWALCALYALGERNVQALRTELPALLQACDEHLLEHLAPASQGKNTPELSPTFVEPRRPREPSPASPQVSEPRPACPHLSACPTGVSQASPPEGSPAESASGPGPQPACPHLSACPTGSRLASHRQPSARPCTYVSGCSLASVQPPLQLPAWTTRVNSYGRPSRATGRIGMRPSTQAWMCPFSRRISASHRPSGSSSCSA